MILLFDRIIKKIVRNYRKIIFSKKIKCLHMNFNLVGSVDLANTNIKLGKNVTIYPGVVFWGEGEIVIGDNVNIGKDTVIYASKEGGVTIGNNSLIAAQCYIIDMDHGTKSGTLISTQSSSVEEVVIGEDVWLAANVTVLKGSKIGDGAVIGAKSLVKGEIPKDAIAVGIPAKVLKYRS